MARVIVTSALPYINGVKHLGNLVGSLLPADIYSRYLRQRGDDVIFICGTDEHGAPAEIAAEQAGLPVDEYCKGMYQVQKSIYEGYGLAFDYFGRTSAPENHALTQRFFLRLYEHGFIEERGITQLYDKSSRRFLPDRYVLGTCPHCGFDSARGDQCDNCTRLLDATDLINPRSAITGSTDLELRESKHLFIKLADFESRLAAWFETKADSWPTTSLSIAWKWMKEGLRSRSITRDLKWGIRVPLAGYEDKVFYVWFDAPLGYISITQEWSNANGTPDRWVDYWKAGDTRLVQFMGKDNVPFHTVVWPATLMGIDDGYVLPEMIKGLEYLNYEGGKFSTSGNRGIFTDTALEEFPADYWRHYLVSVIPERGDTDFSWDGFQAAINDLANVYGNFVHRTLSFCNRYFEGRVPAERTARPQDEALWSETRELVGRAAEAMEAASFGAWFRTLRSIWVLGNRYFDAEAPWVTRKTSPADCAATIYQCLRFARALAILNSPLLPFSSARVFELLALPEDPASLSWERAFDAEPFGPEHRVDPAPKPLFDKIEDARVEQLREKFGGRPVARGSTA